MLSALIYFLTKKDIPSNINKDGGDMRKYLSTEEYLELTNELRELIESKRDPVSPSDFAFSIGYEGHVSGVAFLKVYTEFLTSYPKATVVELHALCLGYGTAGSVLDHYADEDLDGNDNKQFH